MPIPLKLLTPPGLQKYDCTGCGKCCRGGFAIVISEEDHARIAAQGWSAEELGNPGKPLFKRRGGRIQIAHKSNGECVFLNEAGLCSIHARYGEAAKPVGCRMYPFRLIPTGDQVRVDVRFDCPAVAGNLGRPIEAHRPELLKLLKISAPGGGDGAVPQAFYGRVHLSWDRLCRVTEAFERVVLDVSLDITRRVLACVDMAARLREPRLSTLDEDQLDEYLDMVVSDAQADAVNDQLIRKKPAGLEGAAFRQMIGIHGSYEKSGRKEPVLTRLNTSLRMLAGKGMAPVLVEGFPEVSFSDIDNGRGLLAGEAAGVVERYLDVHLTGMGFFGRASYGCSYLDGLNALLLKYPLVCWFARALAVSEGLPVPSASCVQRAVTIVDHQHGLSPLLNIPGGRHRAALLHEQSTLRSLIIWYGS